MLFTAFVCVLVVVFLAVTNAGLLRSQGKDKPKPKPPKPAPIIMAFKNQEESNNMEYHCMNDKRDYVRGTYGMRGYFEGKVVGNNAFVNFWEITVKPGKDFFGNITNTLVPSSGSAVISYSEKWDSVDGPFWNSGSSNITDSYGMWGATEGACAKCVKGMYSDTKLSMFRHNACLWSDTRAAEHWDTLVGYAVYGLPGVSYNAWQPLGVGNENMPAYAGAYKFTYTSKQCKNWGLDCDAYGKEETGNYGLNTISANIASGQVFASEINIRSGPIKANNYNQVKGSGIYVAFQKECEMEGNSMSSGEGYCKPKSGLTGFFCTLSNQGLQDCASDWGDVQDDYSTYENWNSYSLMRNGYLNDYYMYMEGLGTFSYMGTNIQSFVSNNNGMGFKEGEQVSVDSIKKLEAEANAKLIAEIQGKK